jgi:hypothetical protein
MFEAQVLKVPEKIFFCLLEESPSLDAAARISEGSREP